MSLAKNKYIELIRLQTEETFFNESVSTTVKQAINDYKKGSSYLSAYRFDPEKHHSNNNKHTSTRNRGCGCILCTSRYELTQANLAVSRYKKLFEEFNVGLGDRLVAQHRNFLKAGGYLSIEKYYINELNKLKVIAQGAKVRFNSAKDAIEEILCQY